MRQKIRNLSKESLEQIVLEKFSPLSEEQYQKLEACIEKYRTENEERVL